MPCFDQFLLQDTLDAWLTCQAAWQYLEPIFSSPDIMAQMPEEGDKFATVDAAWKDVMDAASADPSALSAGRDRERLETLREANALLDEIQKGTAIRNLFAHLNTLYCITVGTMQSNHMLSARARATSMVFALNARARALTNV